MIREHAFNSRWWGAPVGIVHDDAFFALTPMDQAAALSPFEWVEFNETMDQIPSPVKLQAAGFFLADVHISFRLNLQKVPPYQSAAALRVRSAAQRPFSVDPKALKSFEHERFQHLPGIEQCKIDERFALWSEELIQNSPQFCLEILHRDIVQGWFLSQLVPGRGLNLTLAMLSNDATVSGLLLYQRACQFYAQHGERLGWASFSASNTAVHNIYAELGARFIAPKLYWLWISSPKA